MSESPEGSDPTSPVTTSGSAELAVPSAAELLAGADPVPKAPYRDRNREQKLQQRIDEHELRKKVAKYAYIATASQIVVADVVFILYCIGVSWVVPTPAIAAWLSATVVQVIAVLLVITRYLFPGGPRRRGGVKP